MKIFGGRIVIVAESVAAVDEAAAYVSLRRRSRFTVALFDVSEFTDHEALSPRRGWPFANLLPPYLFLYRAENFSRSLISLCRSLEIDEVIFCGDYLWLSSARKLFRDSVLKNLQAVPSVTFLLRRTAATAPILTELFRRPLFGSADFHVVYQLPNEIGRGEEREEGSVSSEKFEFFAPPPVYLLDRFGNLSRRVEKEKDLVALFPGETRSEILKNVRIFGELLELLRIAGYHPRLFVPAHLTEFARARFWKVTHWRHEVVPRARSILQPAIFSASAVVSLPSRDGFYAALSGTPVLTLVHQTLARRMVSGLFQQRGKTALHNELLGGTALPEATISFHGNRRIASILLDILSVEDEWNEIARLTSSELLTLFRTHSPLHPNGEHRIEFLRYDGRVASLFSNRIPSDVPELRKIQRTEKRQLLAATSTIQPGAGTPVPLGGFLVENSDKRLSRLRAFSKDHPSD